MEKSELQELKKAYNNVFNENGEIKECGRTCTRILISTLKKYTKEDVGDENTGMMKVEILKSVYQRLTAYQGALVI
jgi:hypothetical protein